ncbi:MAG: hypothetical protein EOP48_20675 [Sphingobacteriales bacterium]|nr:MAG: hypothetical protein EOP48_20675 [Sphingobacteriales bacterium]
MISPSESESLILEYRDDFIQSAFIGMAITLRAQVMYGQVASIAVERVTSDVVKFLKSIRTMNFLHGLLINGIAEAEDVSSFVNDPDNDEDLISTLGFFTGHYLMHMFVNSLHNNEDLDQKYFTVFFKPIPWKTLLQLIADDSQGDNEIENVEEESNVVHVNFDKIATDSHGNAKSEILQSSGYSFLIRNEYPHVRLLTDDDMYHVKGYGLTGRRVYADFGVDHETPREIVPQKFAEIFAMVTRISGMKFRRWSPNAFGGGCFGYKTIDESFLEFFGKESESANP